MEIIVEGQRYFFAFKGRVAVLTGTGDFIETAMDKMLYLAGFVVRVEDAAGKILRTLPARPMFDVAIADIRPSQFYVCRTKLAQVEEWARHENIFVPVAKVGSIWVAVDGHTRLKWAAVAGFAAVSCYEDDLGEYITHFVSAAQKRGINSAYDMKIISKAEYKIKWHKYCEDFFAKLTVE